MSTRKGVARASGFLAGGGIALLSLFALQVAVDRLGGQVPALRTFRNYLVHSEGA